jgi:ABC-type amino acid transport substrate-binding protein
VLKTKRIRSAAVVILLLGLALSGTGCDYGCDATGQQTKATIWGSGTDNITAETTAVEEAIQSIEPSRDIDAPATAQDGLLVAACDAASPPLAYLASVIRVESGEETKTIEAVGFEIDLGRAVAKKLGLELLVEHVTWSNLLPSLDTGLYDVIVSAMTTSPERLTDLLATDPYLAADLAICARARHPIADEQDLAGKTVGVQAGTLAQSIAEAIADVDEVRVYSQVLGALDDLVEGNLDAVIAEELPIRWILDNNPRYGDNLAVSGELQTGEGYAFWCTKDRAPLIEAMDAALDELREDGVYGLIADKWGLVEE